LPLCSTCKDVLDESKNARLLDCKHAFCESCLVLSSLEYSKVVKCPLCKEPTILDDSGLNNLAKVDFSSSIFASSSTTYSTFLGEPKSKTSNQMDNNFERHGLSKSFVEVSMQEDDIRMSKEYIEEQEDINEQEDGFIVMESKPIGTPPNFYIPFTQHKEVCKTLVRTWLASMWFAPADLDENVTINEPRAVYVPFYSFNVTTSTTYEVEIANTNVQTGLLDWKAVTGKISSVYEELMTCASYSVNYDLTMKLLKKQGSFSLHTNKILPTDLLPFKQSTETAEDILPNDIVVLKAFEMAGKDKIYEWEKVKSKAYIKEQYTPEQKKGFVCKTKLTNRQYIVVLLPIFASSFSYNGTLYEVLISGNKGGVEGNRPVGSGLIGKMCRDGWKKMSTLVSDSI